jgi:hypothetical protein
MRFQAGTARLEWKDGRISFIRDYRYVGYIVNDARLRDRPGCSAYPFLSMTAKRQCIDLLDRNGSNG